MDSLFCIILELSWIPFALLFLLITFLLYLKRSREQDLQEKDRIERMLKYPLILFILTLLSMPVLEILLKEDPLSIGCKPAVITTINPSCTVLKEFADGTTQKNITFPEKGDYNTEAKITIPQGYKVSRTKLELSTDPEKQWTDNFHDDKKVGSSYSINFNQDEGYAIIKTSKLDVKSVMVLKGSQTFDDIHIEKGGMITIDIGQKLELNVRGTLEIDAGSGINVDGKGNEMQGAGGYGTSTGVSDFGDYGSGGGGGGYGGKGAPGADDISQKGGRGGLDYGSERAPTNLGSMGGNGGGASGKAGSDLYGLGAYGGGAVKINAKEVIINGYISANGKKGSPSAENDGTGGGGGGSGGSIWIETERLALNGQINANGGNGGDDQQRMGTTGSGDGGGGGGAGGRVMISYNYKSGNGKISANGGKTSKGNPSDIGEKGTIEMQIAPREQFVYANITSVKLDYDNIRCWEEFYANSTSPDGSEINFRIINASNNETLCNIDSMNASQGYDIRECTQCTREISLQADFYTIDAYITPRLDGWAVSYNTQIQNLNIDVGSDQANEYSNKSFYGKTALTDENTNPKISDQFTQTAKECICLGCILIQDKCSVPIKVSSESSGKLRIENPEVEYCK